MRWTLAIAALSALALCACGAVCNPVPAVNSSVAAPTGLSVSISNGNQATVKWSGAAAATQFAVSLNPTCVNTFNVSKSSKGSYVFSNLDPLLAYNLTVSAIVGGVVGVPATLSIPSLGVPVGPCGVDTTFNGLTVLALFIGLLLGAALGWVMAQVFQKPAGEKTDAMNANPMRK